MTGIPKDAREVYLNEEGEAIAYCPKESLGLTDIERGQFFEQNRERLGQMAIRAREKAEEEGEEQCVVCIDVDDPAWTPLVEALMPGFDWDVIRARGEKPVARGVVPLAPIKGTVDEMYPAAGDFHENDGITNIVVMAAGGAMIVGDAGA